MLVPSLAADRGFRNVPLLHIEPEIRKAVEQISRETANSIVTAKYLVIKARHFGAKPAEYFGSPGRNSPGHTSF